ncbi:MAG: DUF348 domain-containing protein [Anaerolineae bacterium]|nr:DUF348 domain-containing protein [Anaerolineae bacterium]
MSAGSGVPFWRGVRNLLAALVRAIPAPGLWVALLALALLWRAAGVYAGGLAPLTVTVDGHAHHLRTARATVGEVLADLEVAVDAWDRVQPGPQAEVRPRMRVEVQHARRVTVVADGATRQIYTLADQVDAILAQASVVRKPGDELWVNGTRVAESGAPTAAGATVLHGVVARILPLRPAAPAPIAHVRVRRAALIQVTDGGVEQQLRTTAATLGEALSRAGLTVFLGDRIYPDLNTPVSSGLRVRIERAIPLSVRVDGRTVRTRTHGERVGQVLVETGVSLVGRDTVTPALDAPVYAGMEIRVTRVTETQYIEQEEIPFETLWVADGAMELDHRRVDAAGTNGIQRRRYRIVLQDGVEVERTLEDEWVERDPHPRQIAYGTQIVVRTLDTPDGPIEYWRRIPVFLSSYTEATCGKEPGDHWYGLTRLGWPMRRGIVAVDPAVIPLLTEVYVPGYGQGIAADTGGLIVGRHIDLGYDVDNYEHWFWWGEVYILTPVPPASRIRWILPDYPRGRWP